MEKLILILDTETNGVNKKKLDGRRLISIGTILLNMKTKEYFEKEMVLKVPFELDKEAQHVHKITKEKC